MKKFLFFGAMAAILLGTASCSSDMEPEMTDGTVQFRVELPGAIDSRAISDGLNANKLAVAVYDSEGNELTDLSLTDTKVVTMSDKTATVTFKLVKGQTYSFAFWAQADGAPYTFDTASKTINVDYGEGKVACNNESRDAFYAYKTYEVTGPVNETITLTRPFAQLNFGADDLTAAANAGITPTQSQVLVSKVGTAFNLATGATSGEKDDVTFTLAAIPTDQLKVQDKTYGWLAMNYFLAPGDDAIIEATMTVKTNKADVVVPATNVPVKKNHRTNIVGSLFTEDANFNVIIDQNFDTPDNNINYPEVTDVVYGTDGTEYSLPSEAILADKAKGIDDIVITLTKGTYTDVLTNNNLGTFNSLTIKAAEGVAPEDVVIDGQCFFSSRNVTMKGITLTNANAPGLAAIVDQYGGNGKGFQTQKTLVLIWTSGTYNFENCIFDNVSPDATGIYTYWLTEQSTVNVKNCTFKGSGTLQRAIQIYGLTTATIENCTFTDVYRYCASIHGGSNDIKWINNTVLGDGLNPNKKCNAIEHGSKTYARGADDPQDLIYVEGGSYPATGDKFVPYTIAYDEQPILSGTMPDGSVAIWQ